MKKKVVFSVSVALLLVVLLLACVACTTPDVDSVKEKLTKAGYEFQEYDDAGDYSSAGVTVTHQIGAHKEDDLNEYVLVFWFASSKDANKIYENEKSSIDELKKEYEETGIEFDYKIIKKGKMIAMGTSSAVEILE